MGVAWSFRGVIEGFYGPPWSWDARAEVMRFCHERGMTHYIYAPKDDPLHRDRWRERYPADMVAGFERLVAEGTLRVGFAISPGLSMDYASADDRSALAAKVDQVVDIGIDLICLALDDIDVRPGLGEDHAGVATWLREHLDGRAQLLLVPTEYTGTTSTPYLDALAGGVPDDVQIAWTGGSVVVDEITPAEAEARAASLGGRLPFVWDNYPVNDSIMADRLFLGPLRGRSEDLGSVCSGYATNPMVQPRSSLPALASIAAYLAGDDPLDAWHHAVDALDVRVLAEACDGVLPNELVAAVIAAGDGPDWAEPLRELDAWLREATSVDGAALAEEAGAWIEQVHQEANVGRAATRVLQAVRPVVRADADGRAVAAGPDNRSAVEHALALSMLWPVARRSPVSVMGPRCSFRPVLGQWADGEWRYRSASLIEDANAIDALVRHALDVLGRFEREPRVTVAVDHRPLDVADDGRFDAPPGSEITLTSGPAVTNVTAPTSPPLPDRRLDGS